VSDFVLEFLAEQTVQEVVEQDGGRLGHGQEQGAKDVFRGSEAI
jgi:hypothetical protein